MIRKLLVTENGRTREVLLVGHVVVGRDPDCAISGSDPLLSRRHAEIVPEPHAAVVRDLVSRNGITVNGKKVAEANLLPGDIVQVAAISIQYQEEMPVVSPAAAVGGFDEDDATRVVTQSEWRQVGATATPPPAAAAPEEDDGTKMVPFQNQLRRSGPKPGPPERTAAPAAASRRRVPVAAKQPLPIREGHWDTRVRLACVGMAAATFVITVTSLVWWHTRQNAATEVERASAVAAWLAAEAATLDLTKASPGLGSAIAVEPGVVEFAVITLDGRVVAPPGLAGQAVDLIQDFDVRPRALFIPRQIRTSTGVVVTRPVVSASGERTAVVRLKFALPSDASRGGLMVFIAPAALLTLLVALAAAHLIQRHTTSVIAQFNESIERALNGEIDNVQDPMGSRVSRDLSDAINYMLTRIRNAPDGTARPAAPPRSASWADAGGGQPERLSLRVDAQLHVVSVDPGLSAALGRTDPQLVGCHLLDALPPAVADAVLGGLDGWDGNVTHSVRVPPADGQPALDLEIDCAPGQSVRVTFIHTGRPGAVGSAHS